MVVVFDVKKKAQVKVILLWCGHCRRLTEHLGQPLFCRECGCEYKVEGGK